MLPRERVIRAMEFKSVDKPALECDASGVGLHEHGEKLRELLQTVGSDFGEITTTPIPHPPEDAVDENGSYLEYKTDDWGTKWVYRIFGIHGHPVTHPLDDWGKLAAYKMPPIEPFSINSPEFIGYKRACETHRETYFQKGGWMGLFERMSSLRLFEDVLMDLYTDDENLNALADMLTQRCKVDIDNLLKLDVDAIQFGDDFGTQTGMLISPEIFRRFFKPRYKEMIEPIKAAGKKVMLHSCGQIMPILEDLKEIGIDTLWPQINLYNLKEFASYCRSIGMAIAIHPERSELMTNGTPDMIRRKMFEYVDAFRPQEGGSWFYVEIDNGFPFENIEAMVSVLRELRA